MKKHSLLGLFLITFSIIGTIIVPVYLTIFNSNLEFNTCTIFTETGDGKVFFCNNEDYYPRHTRMWFFPASEGKHGKVLYGFAIHHGFNPLGGMNDQGLSADENWVPSTPVNRDPDKIDYIQNNVFTRILEECATVAEVIEWIKDYNLIQFEMYPCQIHIADKTGDAAIIGVGSDGNIKITRKTGDYLISTNYNVAQGRESCWRYEIVENMLKKSHEVSIEYCRSILEATYIIAYSYPFTKYSNVNDLKNGMLYFFSPHDYDYMAVIDLNEELAKDFHSYDILSLISQRGGLPPIIPLILNTYVVLGLVILGCVLIWIYRIRPNIRKLRKRNATIKKEVKGNAR